MKKLRSFIKSSIDLILNRLKNFEKKENPFDKIYISKIKKNNITVFDCGAGEGASILRFKKILPNCTIHSFEPLDIFYKKLEKMYKDRDDIKINYQGVGNTRTVQKFHKLKKYNGSSFLKPNLNSKWFSRDFSRDFLESVCADSKAGAQRAP